MIEVEINNRQNTQPVDVARMEAAARAILFDHGIAEGAISLAVVDDATIHRLNRRYLSHDYATDVLSFVLSRDGDSLEGEVIVSADTAVASAEEYGWKAGDELLLYVIHGMLHLVGCDDTQEDERRRMREEERRYLALWDLQPRYD